MDREFLDLYERELRLLKEHGREFAEEYPGIADRLGGLLNERTDPMVEGLLQGTAFLAARVQLKIKHEFPEFTANLIEQLVPDCLAPTPSALLARIDPPFADPGLREGLTVPAGAYLDATYLERDRRVACRFQLRGDIVLWPFSMAGAEYFSRPGPLQALGLAVGPEVAAGMRVSLTCRTADRVEDEPPDAVATKTPQAWFAGCRTQDLTVHFVGPEADADALYEQVFGHRTAAYLRFPDEFGDPVLLRLDPGQIEQIGLGEGESLLPGDHRIFRGFELLRDYFIFPRKFLGFRITGLGRVMPRVRSRELDLVLCFDEVSGRLPAAVTPSMFALYAAPAVNLFEKTTDRIPIRSFQHEYQVVPDRSRYLDFEPHRILDVGAHFAGGQEKVPVSPLYSATPDGGSLRSGLFYGIRRMPRRRTARERTFGSPSDYTGTDMFLSLLEPVRAPDMPPVAELSVRALCSNRHLTEHLPVGESGADFTILDNTALRVSCAAGPTPPRGPMVGQRSSRSEAESTGSVTWRLVNMLSLNHLGLVRRGGGRDGNALRETLSFFADLADATVERRIRGVRAVDSRPVTRRVRHRAGAGIARGTEISVTLDEKAFEGSGAFLIGAILDRFFAEYASMNHFTQTVIRSTDRGLVMRWPPRPGLRSAL
jgi:type VI secretion system protein ImpG